MSPVYAAAMDWGDCVVEEAATIKCLEPLFQNVVTAVFAFIGVALLVMLFIAGYNFLLSGGDPKKLEAAKGTLSHALIGLVVIVVAYLIILTIEEFTGVTVRDFTIPQSVP